LVPNHLQLAVAAIKAQLIQTFMQCKDTIQAPPVDVEVDAVAIVAQDLQHLVAQQWHLAAQ